MRAERNTHTWDLKRARSGVDARHATVRTKVADHCTRVVGMIGRVQGLSLEQVQMAIALAVEGVIGYFGRAVHIDGPTCEKIERAIEEVLATRGWGAGRGAHRAARQKGGMGWTSVRAMAAAAYVSKVHRVLNGGDGEPAKVVLAKRIEQVVWRLAGRGDPLEWHPTHLKTILDGDGTVEAWLLCKLEAGVRTRRAAAQRTGEAGGAARVWARVKSGGMGPAESLGGQRVESSVLTGAGSGRCGHAWRPARRRGRGDALGSGACGVGPHECRDVHGGGLRTEGTAGGGRVVPAGIC